jgi:hypothetical protein
MKALAAQRDLKWQIRSPILVCEKSYDLNTVTATGVLASHMLSVVKEHQVHMNRRNTTRLSRAAPVCTRHAHPRD